MASSVPLAGLQRLTTIDFPGYLAAVVFTRGCTWSCGYCHNPGLRIVDGAHTIPLRDLESFLEERRGFLDGIVVSGGEPTMHAGLPDLLDFIRSFGYATALHTNGSNPAILRSILHQGLVDYVALDIKASPRAYDRVTGCQGTCFTVAQSMRFIVNSGVDYEFRTTYHPALLSEEELVTTIRALAAMGTKRYFIQRFQIAGVENAALVIDGDITTVPASIMSLADRLIPDFGVR